MSFARHRNSKRLSFRTTGGRFAKTPSLEDLGMLKICSGCGGFILPDRPLAEGRFVDPAAARGIWPKACPRCGERLPERTS